MDRFRYRLPVRLDDGGALPHQVRMFRTAGVRCGSAAVCRLVIGLLAVVGLVAIVNWLRDFPYEVRYRVARFKERRSAETEAGFLQDQPYDGESEEAGEPDADESDESE